MDMEASRLASTDRDMQMEVFDAVRGQSAFPVQPVRLKPEDTFNFRCHKEIGCWNKCCHGADITLTPNCILRLSKHLGSARPNSCCRTRFPPSMKRPACRWPS
jgi:hypothetical protein